MSDITEDNREYINYSLGIYIDTNLLNLYTKWNILNINIDSLLLLYINLNNNNFYDNKEYIIGYIDIINTNWNDINICWNNIKFFWGSSSEEFKMINTDLFDFIIIQWRVIYNMWIINHNIIYNIKYIIDNINDYNFINNNYILNNIRMDL